MTKPTEEIPTNVPNVFVSDLEKLVKKIRQTTGQENVEVSFEFIIATLFPTSWKNIQSALSQQYTKGYMQGYSDKKQELGEVFSHRGDDPDCYCE